MQFLRLLALSICLHLAFSASSMNTVYASTDSINFKVTFACGTYYQINGGVVLIYVLLLLLFFYAAIVIVERSLAYISTKRVSRIFSQRVALALSANQTQEAINISKSYDASPLATAITNVLQIKQSASQKGFDADAFQVAARNYATAECEAALNKNLAGLKKAGKIALTLGGLGTGICILDALRELQYFDYYDEFNSFFMWRLNESFNVFLFSLFIALPCLWFHKQFSDKAKSLTEALETESWQLINRLSNLPQNKIKRTRKLEKPIEEIKCGSPNQTIECKLFADFIDQ